MSVDTSPMTAEEQEAWEQAEARMNVVGQNGNTGAHYPPIDHETLDTQTFGEIDPTGRDMHDPGAKGDYGKTDPELIMRGFARALDAVAQVATYGAKKYTRDGWESVPDGQRRYTSAMYRHLLAEHQGTSKDADTKLLHAAHTAWNALARLELQLRQLND